MNLMAIGTVKNRFGIEVKAFAINNERILCSNKCESLILIIPDTKMEWFLL